MSPINSRRKGRQAEIEVAKLLSSYWPAALRNLDQFGDDKRDIDGVPGCHIQVKRTETLKIWAAIKQAEDEAKPGDMPIVAFRRNRSGWYAALPLDELAALIHFRETAA